MKVLQLLGCLRGKHLRSRSLARNDGTHIRSRCAGCGRPMVRTWSGWRLDSQLLKESETATD
jgi:hypothetical protein